MFMSFTLRLANLCTQLVTNIALSKVAPVSKFEMCLEDGPHDSEKRTKAGRLLTYSLSVPLVLVEQVDWASPFQETTWPLKAARASQACLG